MGRALDRLCLVIIAFLLLTVLPEAAGVAAENLPRYLGEFSDGNQVRSAKVDQWHDSRSLPTLEGRALFDESNPVRWIVDTQARLPEPSEAFVEFHGGDRLPGRVVEVRTGMESAFHREWSQLMVEPFVSLDNPRQGGLSAIGVFTRWVRRVVWRSNSNVTYTPQTLFLHDGRRLTYQAIRWNPRSVTILLEEGTQEIALSDIGEIHLKDVDSWANHLEQLAVLCPDGKSKLCLLETNFGLRLMCSLERFQAFSHGGQEDPENWYHMWQPAWSSIPLWFKCRNTRSWQFFPANKVPLTLLMPVSATRQPGLGGGWHWQRDRNVQGGPLRSLEGEFAGGIGMHAPQELVYAIPPGTQTFRTRVGLDRSVGKQGGCARAAIYVGSDRANSLCPNDWLIGSQKVLDTGWKAVEGQSQLVLVADAGFVGRPVGTDPFDIRDLVNWYQPEFHLNPEKLPAQLRQAALRLIPAWEGWNVEDTAMGPLQLSNRWNNIDYRYPHYESEVRSNVPVLRINRSFKPGTRQRWFVLEAARYHEGTDAVEVEVAFNGKTEGKFPLPVRNSPQDPEPILLPIDAYRGQNLQVEIRQIGGGPRGLVNWQVLTMNEQRPGIWPIWEDDPQGLDQFPGPGRREIDTAEGFSGSASFKLINGEIGNAGQFSSPYKIRQNPRLGEYRYLRFVWKKPTGGPMAVQLGSAGRWGEEKTQNERLTFRYDGGPGEQKISAKRLRGDQVKDWEVVTRDLVGDWGEFNLSGIGFISQDDQPAWFDQIYLGRTLQDFDKLELPQHTSRVKK